MVLCSPAGSVIGTKYRMHQTPLKHWRQCQGEQQQQQQCGQDIGPAVK